jgi:hypothetical protein
MNVAMLPRLLPLGYITSVIFNVFNDFKAKRRLICSLLFTLN